MTLRGGRNEEKSYHCPNAGAGLRFGGLSDATDSGEHFHPGSQCVGHAGSHAFAVSNADTDTHRVAHGGGYLSAGVLLYERRRRVEYIY